MAERKPNGGGGAASTSSSGTNLLFSSSATEFSFNVPFIPVTQAAAASASLLLPGGNKEMRIRWGKCVRGGGRAAGGGEGRRGGFPCAWTRPSGTLPGPSVARFECPEDFGMLGAGAKLFVEGTVPSAGHS